MTGAKHALPSAVLFDLDGTLADSEEQIAHALSAMLEAFGHDVAFGQIIALLGPPLQGMIEGLIGRAITADELEAMRAEYVVHYEATLHEVRPLPGAPELLAALTSRGVPLALVTNKREGGAHQQLAMLGWDAYFPVVIGADTAARAKPYPEPAIEALHRLGVAPAGAVFVGDTELDMQCGRATGIGTVIGLTGVRTAEVMRAAGATHTCAGLDAVAAVLLGAGALAPQ